MTNRVPIQEPDYFERRIAELVESKDDVYNQEELPRLQSELENVRTFLEQRDEFLELYENHIDPIKTEILLHLQSGSLVAHGRKLPLPAFELAREEFHRTGQYTEDIEPSAIPCEIWVSDRIDWKGCWLKSYRHAYAWITISVEDLLDLFRPKDVVKPKAIKMLPDGYIVAKQGKPVDVSAGSLHPHSRCNWDAFHVEMARRFRDGKVVEMQATMAFDMQDWFFSTFGQRPVMSTIQAKLRPYYQSLIWNERI